MIVVALYSISRDLVKLHRRSLTAMIYMDKFGKILRHYLKERHKISKLAKFEGDASCMSVERYASANLRKLTGLCMMGGKFVLCKFLRGAISLSHFPTWQVYYFWSAFSSGFDRFFLIGSCQKDRTNLRPVENLCVFNRCSVHTEQP